MRGPVAADPRRGLRLWVLPLLAALLAGIAACGAPQRVPCRYPEAVRYAAELDSLGPVEHAALPAAERERRALLASQALRRGLASRRAAPRLQALRTAVGLDPSLATAWLELGRALRLLGDLEAAGRALEQGWQAASGPPSSARDDLRLRLATAQAWAHYDRGEWLRGLEWARRAADLEAGQPEVMLIQGLLEAGALRRRDASETAREIERMNLFRPNGSWIRGVADLYFGNLKEAEVALEGVRPIQQQASGFWRDQALLYEQLGNWRKAARSYRHQAETLPLDRSACLSEHARPHPDAPAGEPALPVWLVFERYPVAGSLHAYAQLALERFEAAADSSQRAFWAEATVAASTYAIRRSLRPPWGHAWRGRLYAQIDLPELARADLRRAIAGFREQGRRHASSLYWLGHVQLKAKEYEAALGNLQEAVAADPRLATAWSDLGYGQVMTGRLAQAREALDRAILLDPQLAVAWYNRGLLHFNDQRWPEAIADLERAATLAPNNREIADLLQRAALTVRQQRAREGGGGP